MKTQVHVFTPSGPTCTRQDWLLHEYGVEGTTVVELHRAETFPAMRYVFVNGYLTPVPPSELLKEADAYTAQGVEVYAPLGWRQFADPPPPIERPKG